MQLIFIVTVAMFASLPAQARIPFVDFLVPEESAILSNVQPTTDQSLERGEVIRLISWNTQKFGNPQAFESLQKMASEADLVLLQETMWGGNFTDFFRTMPSHNWPVAVSFLNRNFIGTGVATGSRYAPSELTYVRSLVREPFTNTPKMILLSKYKIKNSQDMLLVANIHGINFVSPSSFAIQIAQLEKAIEQHRGPLILAGDFNTYLSARHKIVDQMARRQNLIHAIPNNQKFRILSLDHIFYRGLGLQSTQLIESVLTSDHYPISASFTLN